MLNATLRHRRKKTRPQFRVPDSQRAGAIVVSARVKLKEFADQELLVGKWTGIQAGPHKAFGRIYLKLGMVDGVGLLLKLADFRTDEKGALAPEELARFQHEGAEFIEVLQGSALNNTVLNSLMLTILVALMVLHAGDHAYVESAAPQRFGDVASQPNGGAWSDLATFAAPGDVASQEAIRRTVYVLECVLVAISTQVPLPSLPSSLPSSPPSSKRLCRSPPPVCERRPMAGDGIVSRPQLRPTECALRHQTLLTSLQPPQTRPDLTPNACCSAAV